MVYLWGYDMIVDDGSFMVCSLFSSARAGVTRIRRCDLQRIGRLGVGAFGLVTLEAWHRIVGSLRCVSN